MTFKLDLLVRICLLSLAHAELIVKCHGNSLDAVTTVDRSIQETKEILQGEGYTVVNLSASIILISWSFSIADCLELLQLKTIVECHSGHLFYGSLWPYLP